MTNLRRTALEEMVRTLARCYAREHERAEAYREVIRTIKADRKGRRTAAVRHE